MANDMSLSKHPSQQLIYLSRAIGFIGMFFPIAANFIPPSDMRAAFFVCGCILMFIAAAVEKQLFFSLLQLIVLAGASMYFTPFSVMIKAGVPIALSILFLIYFAKTGRFQDRINILGAVGVCALAVGYGVAHPYIYLIGGLSLAIYSTVSYLQGVTVALLWAILNVFFTVATIINIIRF